jgi:hypothetical protein
MVVVVPLTMVRILIAAVIEPLMKSMSERQPCHPYQCKWFQQFVPRKHPTTLYHHTLLQ